MSDLSTSLITAKPTKARKWPLQDNEQHTAWKRVSSNMSFSVKDRALFPGCHQERACGPRPGHLSFRFNVKRVRKTRTATPRLLARESYISITMHGILFKKEKYTTPTFFFFWREILSVQSRRTSLLEEPEYCARSNVVETFLLFIALKVCNQMFYSLEFWIYGVCDSVGMWTPVESVRLTAKVHIWFHSTT